MKPSTVGCCVTVALCCDKQSRTSLGSHCTALPFLSFTLNSQFALVEFATCLSFPQPGKVLMLSSLATLAEGGFLPAKVLRAPRHQCRGLQGPEEPGCTLSVRSLFSSCDSERILMMTISVC